MKLLGIIFVLLSSSVFAEGFSGQVRLQHFERQNQRIDDESFGEVEAYLNYSFANSHKLQLKLENVFHYNTTNPKNEDSVFNDPRLGHIFNIFTSSNKVVTINSDFRAYIGVSENSQDNKQSLSRLEWAPSVMVNLGSTDYSDFFLMYQPYMSKHFNQRDFSETFNAETQVLSLTPQIDYDVWNLFLFGMTFQKTLYIELGYAYHAKWNSLGEQVDDSFDLYQEIEFILNSHISFLLGHVNSGALYSQDGVSEPVTVSGSDSELFYFKTKINF